MGSWNILFVKGGLNLDSVLTCYRLISAVFFFIYLCSHVKLCIRFLVMQRGKGSVPLSTYTFSLNDARWRTSASRMPWRWVRSRRNTWVLESRAYTLEGVDNKFHYRGIVKPEVWGGRSLLGLKAVATDGVHKFTWRCVALVPAWSFPWNLALSGVRGNVMSWIGESL